MARPRRVVASVFYMWRRGNGRPGRLSLTALEAKGPAGNGKKAGAVCVLLSALERLLCAHAWQSLPSFPTPIHGCLWPAQPTRFHYSPPACFRHSPPTLPCTGLPAFYRSYSATPTFYFVAWPMAMKIFIFIFEGIRAPCGLQVIFASQLNDDVASEKKGL